MSDLRRPRASALALGLVLALSPLPGPGSGPWQAPAALADDDGGDGGGGGAGGGTGGGNAGGGGGGDGVDPARYRGTGTGPFNLLRLFGIEGRAPQRPRQAEPPTPQASPRELVASGLIEADLDKLRRDGFRVMAQRQLALLPGLSARLRVPRGLSTARALQRVRSLAPSALVDLNHLYRSLAAPCAEAHCFSLTTPEARIEGTCRAHGTIGMVDTAVDAEHPFLSNSGIVTEVVRAPDYRPARDTHGTDIAILLTRNGPGPAGARVIAVDAFHRRAGGASADSLDLVTALDRLAERFVPIVNLSLAGPANALLDHAGRAMQQRGTVLVAAAGNDGPGTEPRYPAAYPWAVAVTAIDRERQVFARANRGAHIAFAAPGVRIQMPDKALRPGRLRSGTSYAAPLVALAFSQRRSADQGATPQMLVAALSRQATDLGEPGRDPVFGWGLLECRPQPAQP